MNDKTRTIMVLEGAAGTGKTTVVENILQDYHSQARLNALVTNGIGDRFMDYQVTATTNKASRVIGDITGQESGTIHSLLNLKVVFGHGQNGTLAPRKKDQSPSFRNTLFIIDEASYVSQELMDFITKIILQSPASGQAEKTWNKVLFIGDPYQLDPPGGTAEPIFAKHATTATLTTVSRNFGPIFDLAAKYKDVLANGAPFPKIQEVPGFITWDQKGPDFKDRLDICYSKYHHSDDAKVLAYTNQKVIQYNSYISKAILGTDEISVNQIMYTNNPIPSQRNDSILFSTDEAVSLSTILDHQASVHGIPGKMVQLNLKSKNHVATHGSQSFFLPDSQDKLKYVLSGMAARKEWSDYFTLKNNSLDLRPSYACTVHKSQGSSYKEVFIDLDDIGTCKDPKTMARLLYVAFSRASQKVHIYGNLPKEIYNG